jgi:hypothetical protein
MLYKAVLRSGLMERIYECTGSEMWCDNDVPVLGKETVCQVDLFTFQIAVSFLLVYIITLYQLPRCLAVL